jgi:hypothetical protein
VVAYWFQIAYVVNNLPSTDTRIVICSRSSGRHHGSCPADGPAWPASSSRHLGAHARSAPDASADASRSVPRLLDRPGRESTDHMALYRQVQQDGQEGEDDARRLKLIKFDRLGGDESRNAETGGVQRLISEERGRE